jgi:hypothetical protein
MNDYHILPINDLYPHTESINCMCNPLRDDEEANVIIHNAFDGRDIVELAQGEQNE